MNAVTKNFREVPFFNYQALVKPYKNELMEVIGSVLDKGAFILQKELEEFEHNAAKFLGVKHFLGVADGTNAIEISLMAAGIKAGDEVILPSHTYIATASAVHFIGAVPVLVECGPDHLIDSESVKKAITKKTRCIIPVHLNGRTCEMDSIMTIAREHNLKIVEDAAQAFGSKYNGQAAGSFGAAGTISFYPAKVLGSFGDAGGILTNDTDVYERLYALRDHGRDSKGVFTGWGKNCRLDNLQAAVLDYKLKSFAKEIVRRRELASIYQEMLGDIKELTLPPAPNADPKHFDIYQNYELEADNRDELKEYLLKNGVRTLIQWGGKPVHQLEVLGLNGNLPITDNLFKRCLMFPMNTSLSNDDVRYVADTIRAFYKR
jgi:dTDP-4-amino-4,6-dideoxygalactose transaminase